MNRRSCLATLAALCSAPVAALAKRRQPGPPSLTIGGGPDICQSWYVAGGTWEDCTFTVPSQGLHITRCQLMRCRIVVPAGSGPLVMDHCHVFDGWPVTIEFQRPATPRDVITHTIFHGPWEGDVCFPIVKE